MSELSGLPLAAFRLARAFGWTPQQLQTMTMAQIDLYLHFLDEDANAK